MKYFLISLCLTFGLALPLLTNCAQTTGTQTQKPPRRVEGQTLISTELPALRLQIDPAFKYAGSQTFILYDVATAEQHFFVDVDFDGKIKRMYWVQFEGYLPSNTHTYNYKSPKTVSIGGLNFFADSWARNIKDSPGRPDSDGARSRSFLESKGYRLASDEVLSQRLVHLTDETKRNELMIIYLEDLKPSGITAADLAPNGSSAAKWPEVSAGILERAQKGMKINR